MSTSEQSLPVQTFDPEGELLIVERRLPHWAQAGTVCLITWRTRDSMPRQVVEKWAAERQEWLLNHGIRLNSPDWRMRLSQLPQELQFEFYQRTSERWDQSLDECHGKCVLRQMEPAKIVADSFLHFDKVKYWIGDFVVMPNHVHLLASFPDEDGMLKQCESWKRYTTTRINRLTGARGQFWQDDAFDHLVRSPEQLQHFRRYIADNPRRAHLKPGEFMHYTKT